MARGVEIGRGFIAVDTEDGPARNALKSFTSFAADAFKATAVAAGVLVGAAAKVGIEFNSMKEQAEVAFTTLLGSGQAAQEMLANLQKFAASTPFEMEGLISNARNLLGVGVAADRVIPILTAMGNAAGALGLKQDAFDRIMLATTQSMAKGKIQGEELLQFAENGIPIFDLLGKALGVPKEELAKLASEGKLLANATLPLLFEQMQKDFGGAMAAQSKTLAGTWSSLKDNAKILAGTGFKPLFDEAKKVVGILGELAGSDKASAFAERFAEGLQQAIKQTKAFVNDVRIRIGNDLGETFAIAQGRAKAYFDAFKNLASNAFDGLLAILKRILPGINGFLDALGMAVEPALRAVSSVSESFARNADGIGRALATALDVINSVAGPAFGLLGNVISAAASVLSTLLDLVNSAPGFFGTLAGVLAVSIVAWRLLGGSIETARTALMLFSSTGAIASGLKAIGSKIDDVALAAGAMTETLTGSTKAGLGVVNTGTAMSGALGSVASILPAVGGALLAVGAIMGAYLIEQNAIKDAAQGMARSLSEGGQKARDAASQLGGLKTELSGVERAQNAWTTSMQASSAGADDVYGGQLGDKALELRNKIGEVDKQFNELVATLGPVEAAQARYNRAVAEYGIGSSQATAASALWRGALDEEKRKSEAAAAATKTHLDKLLELQAVQLGILNTDIGYRQALSAQEQAQQRAADAVANYGRESQQAKDAILGHEQSISSLISAAGRNAAAQNASKGANEQATAAMNASNMEALRLASIMGDQAPESLKRFVSNLSATQLAALGVTAKVNEAGQAVITMPDGKTVVLKGNNADAKAKIDEVNRLQLQDKFQTIWINSIMTRETRESTDGTGGRAIGGSTRPNVPYWTGERGPEVIFEDRAQYVATAAQSRQFLGGSGGNGGGVFVGNLVLEDGTLMGRIQGVVQQEMDQAGSAIARRRGF